MAVSEDIDYEVDKVLNKRLGEDSEIEYLVRWKGFNSDWDSWEPGRNLGNCGHKVSAFESQLKKILLSSTQNYIKKLVKKSKMTKKEHIKVLPLKIRQKKKMVRDKVGVLQKDLKKLSKPADSSSNIDFSDIFKAVITGSHEHQDKSSHVVVIYPSKNQAEKIEKMKKDSQAKQTKSNVTGKGGILNLTQKNTSSVKSKLSPSKKNHKISSKDKTASLKLGSHKTVKNKKVLNRKKKQVIKLKAKTNKENVGTSQKNKPLLSKKLKSNSNKRTSASLGKAIAKKKGDSITRKRKSESSLPAAGNKFKSTPVAKKTSKYERASHIQLDSDISISLEVQDISFSSDDDISLSVAKKAKLENISESLGKSGKGNKKETLPIPLNIKEKKKNAETMFKSLLNRQKNAAGSNKRKSKLNVSVSDLIGMNKRNGAKSMKTFKSENGSRDHEIDVEQRLHTPKKKNAAENANIEILSDEDSDNNILYSLPDKSYTDSSLTEKVNNQGRTKSGSSVIRNKMKDAYQTAKKSKSTSEVSMDKCGKSKVKKIRLLDSLKSPVTTSTKPVRPVSPTPLFTTVKHTTATILTTSSQPSAQSEWVVVGEDNVLPSADHQASLPISPASMSYKVLLENLPHQLHPKKKKTGEDLDEDIERRVSVRASECAFKYKNILVKKCQKYTQIWLHTHTKMKNSLNPTVMQEICAALNAAKYDDSNLVVFSGLGNVFCSGVDLQYLTTGDRKVAARQMVDALRDLIRKFITFPKLIVAVVTGPAIGLGSTILPLCDIVYASDKATFYMPYALLSQTPEGCASFTLPDIVGTAMANELLVGGRKITAIEACQLGLVSQVYWPTSMMQEVIPRVQHMALLSGKVLETTKLLVRSHQRTKLDLTNESECNLLVERWPSLECQKAMEEFLCNEKNYMM